MLFFSFNKDENWFAALTKVAILKFSFLHFQYFSKNVKIMKVLSVLITKYIIYTNFLVSNTIMSNLI